MKLSKVFLALTIALFVLSACVSEVDRTKAPTPAPTTPSTATPRFEPTPIPTPIPVVATPIPTATHTPVPRPTATPPPPVPLPDKIVRELPHVFAGSVTINGVPAPDGTEITVWVAEYDGPIGTGSAIGGNYSVLAHQHGTISFGGRSLIFKVNGQDTGETGTWERGDATILDISLD